MTSYGIKSISVSTITCSSDATCRSADMHSECQIDEGETDGHCSCVHNYMEDSSWVCVPKVLNSDCVKDSDCGDMLSAKCNATSKCVCKPGFGDYDQNDSCDKVLGRPCVADGSCTVFLSYTTCFAIIGVYQCSCEDNHIEENNICKTALGTACLTDNECVNHGSCYGNPKLCRCNDGYKGFQGYCVDSSYGLQHCCCTNVLCVVMLIILKYISSQY
ncbi:hypothetical protein ACF0H5_012254 [Mactra antiquata]